MFYFVALLSSFVFILSYVFVLPSCLLVRLYSFFSLVNCSAFVLCLFRSYSVCVRRSALFGLLLSCFFLLSSPASLLSSVFFLRSSLFEFFYLWYCLLSYALLLRSHFFFRLYCIIPSLVFILPSVFFFPRSDVSLFVSHVFRRSSFFVLQYAVVVRLSSFFFLHDALVIRLSSFVLLLSVFSCMISSLVCLLTALVCFMSYFSVFGLMYSFVYHLSSFCVSLFCLMSSFFVIRCRSSSVFVLYVVAYSCFVFVLW